MIRGSVNGSRQPVMRLTARGPAGVPFSCDAVIDTGFAGSVALPSVEVASLGLAFRLHHRRRG